MSEVGANQTEYDNGGAIAIKGFNFQHAIAALIVIGNYEKEKFSIYLETKDDIEVVYSDNTFFIQAKNKKLTLNELVKVDKKNKSILSKSLSKTSDKKNNFYKIATITNWKYRILNNSLKKEKTQLKSCQQSHAFQQFQNLGGNLPISNLIISSHQIFRLAFFHRVFFPNQRRKVRLGRKFFIQSLIKITDVHIQNPADIPQTTAADPVAPFFVFLNLLKRNPQQRRKPFL